tara:strand:+ start:1557 stop:1898 length:342 start_codon:yes stop_codon:yes gene_type:complete
MDIDFSEALEAIADGSNRYGADYMYAVTVGTDKDGEDGSFTYVIATLDCYAGNSGEGSSLVDFRDYVDMVEGFMNTYGLIVGNIVEVRPSSYSEQGVLFGLEVEVGIPHSNFY